MSRAQTRRARGQGVVAVLIAAALVAAGVALDRTGRRPGGAAGAGTAPSGAWFCPHGGGKDWKVAVGVANPGTKAVKVRVSSFGSEEPSQPNEFSLEAGASRRVSVPAEDRSASTMVEYFGGFAAAGWVAVAGGGESGVAAEPCAPDAGNASLLPGNTTEKGKDSYVVVMNPFAADAVFSLKVFTEHRAPIQTTDVTDFVLKPHRSTSFHLNELSLGERSVGVEVRASLGRIAAASLGVSQDGGIWSTVGLDGAGSRRILPGGQDSGLADLAVLNTGADDVQLKASLLGRGARQTATGAQNQLVEPRSANTFSLETGVPSTIDVNASGASMVTARRSGGVEGDLGSTAGAAAPAEQWVVLPTTGDKPYETRLALANPGETDVTAALTIMGEDGPVADPAPLEVTVPAGLTVIAPADFTNAAPQAAVHVRASGGAVAALSASYSSDRAAYAVATGVEVSGAPT